MVTERKLQASAAIKTMSHVEEPRKASNDLMKQKEEEGSFVDSPSMDVPPFAAWHRSSDADMSEGRQAMVLHNLCLPGPQALGTRTP